MNVLLFGYPLLSYRSFFEADQDIESDDGSNSGQSGCKSGTFKSFLYHSYVICNKLHIINIS
jgi:hypothetical protein